jgi:RimJ/RimL family protein N-acetyltransferase
MVVVANSPEYKELAAKILQKEIGVQPSADMQAIFWVNDTTHEIEWVTGYTSFIGKTCQMHFWSAETGYTPREFLRVAFDYPFNQAGRDTIFGICNSLNTKAMKYDAKVGMEEVIRFPAMHDDGGDLVLFQMRKDKCRWIKEKQK